MTIQVVTAEPAVTAGTSTNPGRPAASWPAIVAGSVVAISVSLILLALGTGLGLASLSPWAEPASATGFAIGAAIWLVVTQWVSAALGGYIAGRLRSRWIGTHTHEIFFRDTAHGLVTWAVATVLIAALAGGSVHSLLSGGVRAAASAAQATAQAPGSIGEPYGSYGIDKMFRTSAAAPPAGTDTGGAVPAGVGGAEDREARSEAQRIMAHALAAGRVPDADRTYLNALVAARTGLSASEAQRRVDEWVSDSLNEESQLKAAAETGRRNLAQAAIYTSLSLLIGAFVASVAAALGGRLRDLHP